MSNHTPIGPESSGEPGQPDTTVSRRPSGKPRSSSTLPDPPNEVSITEAQPARMGDYLAGGVDNFSVDRDVTEYITGALPGGTEVARAMVRANRDFMERAVRHIAAEAGVRQFLDIGTRMPTQGRKLHELVHEVAPDARFAYVIDDSVVLAHAHELRESTPEGGVAAYLRGNVDDPEEILRRAGVLLDLTESLAFTIRGRLIFIRDDDVAQRVVARLLEPVASGSYLAMTHLATDLRNGELADAFERLDEMAKQSKMPPVARRGHAEIARLFDGLELLGPGLVPADHWQPDDAAPPPADESTTFMYGAVCRKP